MPWIFGVYLYFVTIFNSGDNKDLFHSMLIPFFNKQSVYVHVYVWCINFTTLPCRTRCHTVKSKDDSTHCYIIIKHQCPSHLQKLSPYLPMTSDCHAMTAVKRQWTVGIEEYENHDDNFYRVTMWQCDTAWLSHMLICYASQSGQLHVISNFH